MQINYNFPYFQKRLTPRHKARLESLLSTIEQSNDKNDECSTAAIATTQAANVSESASNDVKVQGNLQTFKQLP